MNKLFKNKAFLICISSIVTLIIIIGCVFGIGEVRIRLKGVLERAFPDKFGQSIYYINNVKSDTVSQMDFLVNDVREVKINSQRSYLINHSRGFALGFPNDAEYDFSAAQEYINVSCEKFSAVVSKEYTTYAPGVEESKRYVSECINKYILSEKYLKENSITLHKNDTETVGDYPVQIIALTRTPEAGSKCVDNTYVYCYIYKDDVLFYRIMFKAREYDSELLEEVYKTLESFTEDVMVKGVSDTFAEFYPVINDDWNEKTRALYEDIVNSKECKWGVFVPRAVLQNNYRDVLSLEEKVASKFDGVLEYMFLCDEVPKEGMKSAFADGKIIELTLQTANAMHANLDGHNPMFDIIDGKYDEKISKIARDIKELHSPVLFRLNNEMNSDWVGYSAAACLTDPEIYVAVWRRIYDIFEKENVDNAIWVFNPNDETFPPNGYNASMAYYPGNEYVHIFGITGYNTGTYYEKEHGERWRTFDEIYTNITEHSEKTYGKFPWIITEFASSSIGGDKAEWINDMFESLKDYPHIKMAFWFNAADYDERPEKEGCVARPYWLDETDKTTQAFKNGLRKK